jgi:hypothetical protein
MPTPPDRTHRRAVTSVALACVAALALSASACGGDSDASGEDSTLTRAEFIERADAICQQMYTQRDPLEIEAARAAQAGDSARAAEVFENAAEITENRVAELRELPVPPGDEEQVAEILDRAQSTADTARVAAEAIREQDPAALDEQSREGALTNTRFSKAAIQYGFFVCGRGAQATIG